jgi:hypothetical protein
MSPTNSFRFMDDSLDMFYSRPFGRQVQDRLQTKITPATHFNLQWLIEGIQI